MTSMRNTSVVQRRRDGAVSFNRGWEEYREGFGFLSNDFWMGNEKLSYITNQASYTLRIDMVLSNGSSVYVEYDAFRVSDEWNNYSLFSVGGNTENASSVVNFTEVFTDCYDVYQSGQRQDGIYTILPLGWSKEPFPVPCNMSIDDGGWTVLQRRVNDSVNFNHNWEGYKHGFGVLDHELWLGNEKIYFLTNQKDYELRLDMVNVNEDAYFAKYNLFRISSESFNYQLTVGDYDASSTTGFDAMDQHRGRLFSTPDRDNDGINRNCALNTSCGWWFGNDQGNLRQDPGPDAFKLTNSTGMPSAPFGIPPRFPLLSNTKSCPMRAAENCALGELTPAGTGLYNSNRASAFDVLLLGHRNVLANTQPEAEQFTMPLERLWLIEFSSTIKL
ncbi:Fibrinogen C domain-containing protein 1-A [Holothuria leucospilota]|uniref:Fibrinogen C domain-containing protein 1-A n=1 Tax=Holothuria leucospilota TaxID=206669 RepID=A0A9Q1BFG9_HOLLE|nr:Fibrinogen C domain-containing protein 1-A [Holothuria leucospilota]